MSAHGIPAAPVPSSPAARPWRCRSCNALLGMHANGELHIKYKELELRVAASERVATTCRRCKQPNETGTLPAA